MDTGVHLPLFIQEHDLFIFCTEIQESFMLIQAVVLQLSCYIATAVALESPADIEIQMHSKNETTMSLVLLTKETKMWLKLMCVFVKNSKWIWGM